MNFAWKHNKGLEWIQHLHKKSLKQQNAKLLKSQLLIQQNKAK